MDGMRPAPARLLGLVAEAQRYSKMGALACYADLKMLAFHLGLRTRHGGSKLLSERLRQIAEARAGWELLKEGDTTFSWFHTAGRPQWPEDALSVYRLGHIPKPEELARITLDWRRAILKDWGIREAWEWDGSAVVDVCGWWWMTGIAYLMYEEINIYQYHMRAAGTWGWLRSMIVTS